MPVIRLFRDNLFVSLFALLFFVSLFSGFVGVNYSFSSVSLFEYFIFSLLFAFAVVFSMWLYFFIQSGFSSNRYAPYVLSVDSVIPFVPFFVWVYTFLYVLAVVLVIVFLPSLVVGIQYLFGGVLLVSLHCFIFYFFPSSVPISWRRYSSNGVSSRFLRFLQSFDSRGNAFPSLHMSVTTCASLLLVSSVSVWFFLCIPLIAFSCLFVKQHTLLDVLGGVLVGLFFYSLFVGFFA